VHVNYLEIIVRAYVTIRIGRINLVHIVDSFIIYHNTIGMAGTISMLDRTVGGVAGFVLGKTEWVMDISNHSILPGIVGSLRSHLYQFPQWG
jgi:hypothetical protein